MAAVAAALTERDQAVLRDLGRLRQACTRQIERLHFASGESSADGRHCRRVLAKLTALGVVRRLERRVGGVRAGSAGYVYALDTLGQHLVTGVGPAGGQIRRPWTSGPAFLRHRLAITELFVQLVEAERHGGIELVSFLAEPDSWRRYGGPGGGSAVLKPDALAVVVADDYEHAWFVEVDLGSESPAALARKLAAYGRYRATGREQVASGLFPLVVFLVPTAARLRVMQRVLAQSPRHDQELFRIGLLSDSVAILAGRQS